MNFAIVVAIDQEAGIGKEGKLPWHLPGDLKHFKELTCRTKDPSQVNAVIMGRKTWDSLPAKFKPLPQRLNIVITHNHGLSFPDGVLKAESLSKALDLLSQPQWKQKIESLFVIGGAQLYQAAIEDPGCRKIFLTQIQSRFQCDTFFPDFKERFKLTKESPKQMDGKIEFSLLEYTRA